FSAMLRTRLFLNLLPFVVILLAVGLYAIALFSRLATSLDVTVAENYRSLLAAQEMSLALVAMEREIWVSSGKVNPDRPAFTEQKKRFDENLALQLKGAPLPGEEKLNRQLSADYEAFRAASSRMSAATNAESRHQL